MKTLLHLILKQQLDQFDAWTWLLNVAKYTLVLANQMAHSGLITKLFTCNTLQLLLSTKCKDYFNVKFIELAATTCVYDYHYFHA